MYGILTMECILFEGNFLEWSLSNYLSTKGQNFNGLCNVFKSQIYTYIEAMAYFKTPEALNISWRWQVENLKKTMNRYSSDLEITSIIIQSTELEKTLLFILSRELTC